MANVNELVELIATNKVSSAIAYQRLFPALLESPKTAALELAQSLNILQNADEGFLEQLIDEVLKQHPDKVKAYQKGKKNLLGMFMGQVMRNSKGKADPKATNQMLIEKLEKWTDD